MQLQPEPIAAPSQANTESNVCCWQYDRAQGRWPENANGPPVFHQRAARVRSQRRLVAVVVGLEGAARFDADISGLLVVELGQLDAEFGQMKGGNLLIEVFG